MTYLMWDILGAAIFYSITRSCDLLNLFIRACLGSTFIPAVITQGSQQKDFKKRLKIKSRKRQLSANGAKRVRILKARAEGEYDIS